MMRHRLVRQLSLICQSNWHWRLVVIYMIAEADRSSKELNIYIDDKRDSSGSVMNSVSINNDSDQFVCGIPYGKYLKGAVELIY